MAGKNIKRRKESFEIELPKDPLKKLRVSGGLLHNYLRSRFQNYRNMARYKTASQNAYYAHGRDFFLRFETKTIRGKGEEFTISTTPFTIESPHSIEITCKTTKGQQKYGSVGRMGLGFSKDAVIVEVMQGKQDALREQEHFRQNPAVKMPWANYLISEVEKRARELGFSQVKIRTPESLYSYHFSAAKDLKQVQHNMDLFYYAVASSCGYVRRGFFYIKKLS